MTADFSQGSKSKITASEHAGSRESGATRQIAEAFVFLAIAVIGFRGFIVEGYMISTGSMAPCLLGFHRQVVCPDCAYAFSRGTRYDTDDTILAEGESTDFGVSEAPDTVCPNCGLTGINVNSVPRNEGDQLLVHKHFYQFRPPRRWEVVVFRHPSEPHQAYVKRVAGLPGEVVELIDGDVIVDGVLQRKSLTVQRSMRISVYDNDFEPLDEQWHPRWEATAPRSSWQADGSRFLFHPKAHPDVSVEGIDWLTYRHWIRQGGNHVSSVELEHWPVADRPPGFFLPSLKFDPEAGTLACTGVLPTAVARRLLDASHDEHFRAAVARLAEISHLGEITDIYGYNHPQSARVSYPVHDLMVSARVEHVAGDGEFRVRMTDGWHWFQAVFDFTTREARLIVEAADEPLHRAPLPKSMLTGEALIEMSTFDRRILVAVDGHELFPPLEYTARDTPRSHSSTPVLLGGEGIELVVDKLQLYRDVYYTPKDAGDTEHPIRVGPEELMVLGDNSPVSVDSRSWESPTIPQNLLIGKPFLVHLPSQQERVQIGGRVHHIRIPDFTRVRYIH